MGRDIMKKGLIYAGSGLIGVGLIVFLYNQYASHSGGMIYSGETYSEEGSEEEESGSEEEESEEGRPYSGWPFGG